MVKLKEEKKGIREFYKLYLRKFKVKETGIFRPRTINLVT